MADEELRSAQKLAIGANFVLNSPPAQVNVVMEGALRFFFREKRKLLDTRLSHKLLHAKLALRLISSSSLLPRLLPARAQTCGSSSAPRC